MHCSAAWVVDLDSDSRAVDLDSDSDSDIAGLVTSLVIRALYLILISKPRRGLMNTFLQFLQPRTHLLYIPEPLKSQQELSSFCDLQFDVESVHKLLSKLRPDKAMASHQCCWLKHKNWSRSHCICCLRSHWRTLLFPTIGNRRSSHFKKGNRTKPMTIGLSV